MRQVNNQNGRMEWDQVASKLDVQIFPVDAIRETTVLLQDDKNK